MLRWVSILLGGLLIMMGHHARSEALFYYRTGHASVWRSNSSNTFQNAQHQKVLAWIV